MSYSESFVFFSISLVLYNYQCLLIDTCDMCVHLLYFYRDSSKMSFKRTSDAIPIFPVYYFIMKHLLCRQRPWQVYFLCLNPKCQK